MVDHQHVRVGPNDPHVHVEPAPPGRDDQGGHGAFLVPGVPARPGQADVRVREPHERVSPARGGLDAVVSAAGVQQDVGGREHVARAADGFWPAALEVR